MGRVMVAWFCCTLLCTMAVEEVKWCLYSLNVRRWALGYIG